MMDDGPTVDVVDAPDPVLAKILAMAFLGVSSFVVGSTPVCVFERMGIRRRARGAANAVLRLILNFGGGVLLCTTFLHLLPEVREGVERMIEQGDLDPDLPAAGLLAELIMCVGFFFMYSVEELVHGFAAGSSHHHHQHHHHHHHQHSHSSSDHHHHGRHHHHEDDAPAAVVAATGGGGGHLNSAFDKSETVVAGRVANYNSCTSAVEIAAKKTAREQDPESQSVEVAASSVFRGFLVVGALSIHELFEGLAVGLEKNPAQVWSLAVAVACHKLVIAFYVGLQMLSDRTKPLLAHCSILLFAVTSPIGIGVGALVSNLEETSPVVVLSVILQGLATGTLMYVVFFEVLKPSVEHLNVKQRILRLLFIAIGFVTMLSIQLMLSEK